MLVRLIQRAASIPWVYDLVQRVAGMKDRRRRLRAQIDQLPTPRVVMDVGGGTGNYADLWPADCRYINLDHDLPKLRSYLAKSPQGLAVQGSAAHLPLADGCLDAIACIALSHHLTDEDLEAALSEAARVLRPGGTLIFLDALEIRDSALIRFLWRSDRGRHPRREEVLRTLISSDFSILLESRYRYIHQYLLCVAVPCSTTSSSPPAAALSPSTSPNGLHSIQ